MDGLLGLLAADVEVRGDSGGVPPSWRKPIVGREHVGRLLAALGNQVRHVHGSIRQAEVNGQPGALALAPDGSLISVLTIDIADGQVQTVRSVISRAKLRHLGPLADLGSLRPRQGGTS
jgi:RNA polymerase sigma-70 factor, ECF subfamily